jgi:hypothetical protein
MLRVFVTVLGELDFNMLRHECDWDGLDRGWACHPPQCLDFDETFSTFISASVCLHHTHILSSLSTQHTSFHISLPPCHISQFFSHTSYTEGVDIVISTKPESTSRWSSLSANDGSDDGDFVNAPEELAPSIGSSRLYTPPLCPVLSYQLLWHNPSHSINSSKFRPKLRLRDSHHAAVELHQH